MADKTNELRSSPIRKPVVTSKGASEKENARKLLVTNPMDVSQMQKSSHSHSVSKADRSDKDGKEKRERSSSNGNGKPPQKQKRTEQKRVVPSGYIENDAVYPETMASFLDGIKTDFEAVVQTMYSTAFSFWSDEAGGNNGNNRNGKKQMRKTSTSTSKHPPAEGGGGKTKVKKKWQADEAVALAQQNDALAMRLPSLWSNKASTSAALAEAIRSKDKVSTRSVAPSKPSEEATKDDGNDSSSVSSDKSKGSKKSRGSNKGPIRVKQGDIVNLAILSSKTSLVSFECYDNHILIIGSRRMIMTQIIDKNNQHLYDLDGDFNIASGDMARVVWSQNLVDVDSCTISFANTDSARFNAQLDLIVSNGKKTNLTVILPDAGMCSEVLQAIQQKKVGKVYVPSDKTMLFKQTGAPDPAGPMSTPTGQVNKGGIQMSPIRPQAHSSSAGKVRSSSKPGTIFNTSTTRREQTSEEQDRDAREAREEGEGKRTEASAFITGTPGDKLVTKCTTPAATSNKTLTPLLQPPATNSTPGDGVEVIALTPLTYTKVDICVRQMKHGVGHYGVKSKLVSDGVEETRASMIIENATKVLNGAKLGLIPGSRRIQIVEDDHDDTQDVKDGNRSEKEVASTVPDGLGMGGLIGAVDLLTARRGSCTPRMSSPISIPGMDLAGDLVQENNSSPVTFADRCTVSPEALPVSVRQTASLTTEEKVSKQGASDASRPPMPPVNFLEEMMRRRTSNTDSSSSGNDAAASAITGSISKDEAEVAAPPSTTGSAMPPTNFLEEMMKRRGNNSTPVAARADGKATKDTPVAPVPATTDTASLAKYAKMLKMGIPRQGVANKMLADGVAADANEADRLLDTASSAVTSTGTTAKSTAEASETDTSTANESTASSPSGGGVTYKDHPKYAKYFKMLKMGLPKQAVMNKMAQDGCKEVDVLDKDPNSMVSEEKETPQAGSTIALKDHPKYAKYFKMLKMGLPKQAVTNKMLQEGIPTSILDRDPEEQVSTGTGNPADLKVTITFKNEKPKRKERKKKLHWDGLNLDAVSAESLWYEEEEEEDAIAIDDEEFKSLFVEVIKTPVKKGTAKQAEKEKEEKDKKVTFIEGRRSQNAEIALSRLRGMTVAEIRKNVEAMEDRHFSCDQLENLIAYLPTAEETRNLRGYKGDLQLLGPVEKFMIEMLKCDQAEQRLRNMVFKQQLPTRVSEVKHSLGIIERACDDVKMSLRLKKVMKSILKVGNQLNHNESNGNKAVGFRLDSLAKLKNAKAFDNKTSVLQYIIMLIHRSDESTLQWYEDMANVQSASRCGLEDAVGEVDKIVKGLEGAKSITDSLSGVDIAEGGCSMGHEADSLFTGYRAFLQEASAGIDSLSQLKVLVQAKYGSVVEYFGEDRSLPSHTLFSMLQTFSNDFKEAQQAHARAIKAQKKAEEREAAKAMKDENSSSSQSENHTARGRRATTINHQTEKDKENSRNPTDVRSTSDVVKAIEGSANGKQKSRRASIL